MHIRQEKRSLADYATLAAESDWGSAALMVVFQQGLNKELKDELAPRDPPSTLEDLIEIALKLDIRLWERRRTREMSEVQSGVFLNAVISWGQDCEEHLRAFVDSGAAGNFIDAALARALCL